ncbi:MAG TPA: GNAT family N-acetyltransferase [Nitrospira sp.]|jgi:GNAT superfamily N-acetyltransferase|nr:GNAT family N-acetyltransferase [Nitrospira sp.]
MHLRILRAEPAHAPAIADMVGELLREIMTVIGSNVFSFDSGETENRLRTWLGNGTYTVFVAHGDRNEVMGFLALYESHALYAQGAFGTIPELYVRPAFRSQGVGAGLLAEARQFAASKGWTRLEVTTPPLPQFQRTLTFYERHNFSISGGRKMKADVP